MESERSFEPVLEADLEAFAKLAASDREDFFERHQRESTFLFAALCQGAALHFVNGSNGVKDIDVWSFYRRTPAIQDFPVRRRAERDLGHSKFGVHPEDAKVGYKGRRVDLLGRSIDLHDNESELDALRRYLREAKTGTAWHLSQKPVVIIDPPALRGQIVWPLNGE